MANGWDKFFKGVTDELGEVIEERIKHTIEGEIEGDFDEEEIEAMKQFYINRLLQDESTQKVLLDMVKEAIWDDKADRVSQTIEEVSGELINPPKELC